MWQLNAVRVEELGRRPAASCSPRSRMRSATPAHRKLVVHDEKVGRAARAACWRDEGWNVYRLLVMVHDRAVRAQRGAGRGRARSSRASGCGGRWPRSAREQPFGWQAEAVAAAPRRWTSATGAPSRARDFAAPPDDPAAACRLYTADGLAQVDEVGTLERRRGPRPRHRRGAGRGRTTALAEGCDPVFLLTDAADWPQQLYRRLGFSPIGLLYEFLKLPLGESRSIDRGRIDRWTCSPCVVQDARTGEVLTLAYMNEEALRARARPARCGSGAARATSCGTRGRPRATSSACEALRYDCDEDALLALVEPAGPACHTGERTCFYRGDMEPEPAEALPALERTIARAPRRRAPTRATRPSCWPTRRAIGEKVREEAEEVARAAARRVRRAGGRGGRRRALPPDRAAGLARPDPGRRLRGAQ